MAGLRPECSSGQFLFLRCWAPARFTLSQEFFLVRKPQTSAADSSGPVLGGYGTPVIKREQLSLLRMTSLDCSSIRMDDLVPGGCKHGAVIGAVCWLFVDPSKTLRQVETEGISRADRSPE